MTDTDELAERRLVQAVADALDEEASSLTLPEIRQLAEVAVAAYHEWVLAHGAEYTEQAVNESHRRYERHAKASGWQTQPSTRDKEFSELPPENQATMRATFKGMLTDGVLSPGPGLLGGIREEET